MSRMSIVALLFCVGFCSTDSLASQEPGQVVSPDEGMKRLLDGNKRYIAGSVGLLAAGKSDTGSRQVLAKGQSPYAIILSCSDSRVPPELIFDQGLGEIFVVRVAGNIADPVVLGSIEYAAEHLGSTLVVVLGHERCGAVTATVESDGRHEGNIDSIIKQIHPAVVKARAKQYGSTPDKATDKAMLVEAAIDENVKHVRESLVKQSSALKHLVESGKLKIVAAKYDLDDGVVSVFKD